MNETPRPYSPEAQGTQQIAAEAQQLAEAYDRGLRGIESQVAHQQNQALIAELLERQTTRQETGQTYLSPVRTRVETPAPVPPPAPEQTETPLCLWLDGQPVARADRLSPDESPGPVQVRNERAQRAENLARAMDGRYHTSQEKAQMQRIENGWARRFA